MLAAVLLLVRRRVWLEANRPGRAKRTAGRSDYHELRF